MTVLVKLLFLILLIEHSAFGNTSTKESEGYPQGYLGDCPGSTKPAFITKRSLSKYLGIVVVGGDGSSRSYRRTYMYHQAKEISKDPNLDFKNKKTVFFFGGFMDSPNFLVSGMMAQAYRKLGYNVLLMEANRFITIHYPISARYMRPVGKHLAEMLTNLTASGLDTTRFEMAGVSLGAQIMSYVAKNIQHFTGRNISKLTGLDPSGPCFRNLGPEERLDASDADFVQVVNTNIDGFGMAAPIGHVNFYVNGGEYQPGDFYWMPCTLMCSHVRSYTIWLSALSNPKSFIGIKCDSVQQARNHDCYDRVPRETNVISNTKTDRNNHGIFYVATDNNWPYYLGSRGLRKEYQFWTSHLLDWNKNDVIQM